MKRTLYPKLLGGYLIYGLICFIIISTFGYHITFNFLERRDASTLYRESALISSNYAENYFKRSTTLEEMKTQLSTLSTYLSSEIWIIDKQGQILLNTASATSPVENAEPEVIPDFDVTDFGSKYYRTGNFYGHFDTETLSVFSPITVNYKVRGYVIIHKPVSSIVNLSNYSVIYKDNPIDMPPKELELLYFLASSPNQVFTREQLLDHIWGYEYIGDTRTVDVHVKRLREKIKDNDSWSLSTVWGIGYKFEVKNI